MPGLSLDIILLNIMKEFIEAVFFNMVFAKDTWLGRARKVGQLWAGSRQL
jgi:hypothetical protein